MVRLFSLCRMLFWKYFIFIECLHQFKHKKRSCIGQYVDHSFNFKIFCFFVDFLFRYCLWCDAHKKHCDEQEFDSITNKRIKYMCVWSNIIAKELHPTNAITNWFVNKRSINAEHDQNGKRIFWLMKTGVCSFIYTARCCLERILMWAHKKDAIHKRKKRLFLCYIWLIYGVCKIFIQYFQYWLHFQYCQHSNRNEWVWNK